ncbi:MAG TPA: serine hydrolase domain-containing protein [Chloroflexota bacterium]|jgi:D-alanyl-D-alanine carboxypeptidase|nr:serine hydrolase domain-containing protein [Chloroflexota bacterium]
MVSAGAAQQLAQLDAVIARRMAAARTPGMAVAYFDRQTCHRVAVYGLASLEQRTPVTPRTLFQIGSITKSFTALAVVQLAEQGRLDLHRPVTDYLPWFRVQSTFAPITLHHLLTHSAGLVVVIDRSPDIRGAVWALRETEVAWPPGSRFFYSDAGYQTLALVLEAVTGRPFASVIRSQIFEPLEMAESEAAVTHALRPRLATGYRGLYDDRPPHRDHPLVPVTWMELSSGECSIAATAADMARYGRMWLNRGNGPHGPLVSPEGFELMTRPHISAGPSAAYGYGIAREQRDGTTSLAHGGGMPGYAAHLVADLDHGVGLVTLSTRPQVSGISHDLLAFWRAVSLGHTPPPIDVAPQEPRPVTEAAAYAGRYRLAVDGSDGYEPAGDCGAAETLELAAAGERLLLRHLGQEIDLEPRGRDRFYLPHLDFDRFLLQFRREPAPDGSPGAVRGAVFGPWQYAREPHDLPSSPTGAVRAIEEVRVEEVRGARGGYRAYAGHYRSHHPWESNNFRVILRGEELLLVQPHGDETPLVPCSGRADEFWVGEAPTPQRIRFDQVADGRALRATLAAVDYYRFFVP